MTAPPKKKLTFEEYYALEQADPWKNEFFKGEMIPLDHTGWPHNAILTRLVGAFGERLKDTSYQSLSSRMRVFFPASGLYTYPDILILPWPPECTDDRRETVLNPHVLVEVLTAASEVRVRRTMHRHYMRAASVCEIVLVADDEPRIEQYTRTEGGDWTFRFCSDLSETLSLATVSAAVPLADIYANLDLPAEPIVLHPPQ